MTRVQILEKDGRPAFAVVPIEVWERVRELIEDVEDAAAFDAAIAADDGFRIPLAVVKEHGASIVACRRIDLRSEPASARPI